MRSVMSNSWAARTTAMLTHTLPLTHTLARLDAVEAQATRSSSHPHWCGGSRRRGSPGR